MASVFISYSHVDEVWKDRLLRHFRVFERQGLAFSAWQDREIPGGGDWEAEIRKAMAGADAAVLLVSADSLGSKFINEVEVPYLLGRRERDGLPFIPIVVAPCNWKDLPWLQKLNLRPRDGHPLSGGTDHEIEDQLAAIAAEVFRLATKVPGTSGGPTRGGAVATRADWRLVHPYGMPPNFTGRVAERGQLTEWVEENGPALLVLRALGGFGKSALAWHWLMNDVNPCRWTRVVWWSFYDDSSFNEFLREVLGYLGVNADALSIRDGVRQLVDLLRRSPVLLVLDGFERALRAFARLDAAYHLDEEEKLLGKEEDRDCVSLASDAFLRTVSSLPGLAGRVILTTRLRPRPVETRVGEVLAGCREIELTALSKADAVDFFHAEGIRGTRAEIEAVCGSYGFHPLSLRLLAGLIVKDFRNPRDIAVAQRLDVSGDLVQRKHHVLEQSYKSLPVKDRRLLSRIACFRGAVDYKALYAAAGGLAENEVEIILKDLLERGLLHHEERDGRFDLHPIVRRYSYDRLGMEEKEDAHRRLRDYFAAVPPLEKVKTLTDLAPMIERYHHMVRAGDLDRAHELFRDRLHEELYYQLGAYESCIELLRALLPDGGEFQPRLTKEIDQGWTLITLANSYSLSGQPKWALPLFEQAVALVQRPGEERNLAIALGNLAFMSQHRIGAFRSGEVNIRRSIELFRELGDTLYAAFGCQELGRMLGFRGYWEAAENELAEAFLEFEKSEHAQRQGFVWANRALLSLQRLRADVSDSQEKIRQSALLAARSALEMANVSARADGPKERDFVQAHWLLGAALGENRDIGQADRHLTEALERCRRINLVEKEADILIELGRLRRLHGEKAEARRLGEEASGIAERCGYVLQGADAHLLLAAVDRDAGDHASSCEHALEAKRLATCDGPPDYTYKVAYDEAVAMLAEGAPPGAP